MVSPTFSKIDCSHHIHLFAKPLCGDLKLINKIANVVFHILTLGIPIGIYHLVDWLSSRKIEPILPYSSIEQEALSFANNFLETKIKESPIEEKVFFDKNYSIEVYQPFNPTISYLANIWDAFIQQYYDALAIDKDNGAKLQEIADSTMKIGYTISILTLEELDSFVRALEEVGMQREYKEILTSKDFYQRYAINYCSTAYHCLRGNLSWDSQHKQICFPESPALSDFYKPGTLQNGWNQLYNAYCQRVRMYVSEEELRDADEAQADRSQPDLSSSSYVNGLQKFHAQTGSS